MTIAPDIEASTNFAAGSDRATRPARLTSLLRIARRYPLGGVSAVVCIVLIVLAIAGPQIAPYAADTGDFERLEAPSGSHPFGTDNLFRDIFSRIIVGARNSLGIGFSSVSIATALGVALGLSAGYLGGTWDLLVSRVTDIAQSIPPLVFLIFFLSIFSPNFLTVCAAIGFVLVPATARVVRASTIGVRNLEYIEGAVVLGSTSMRIMWRHILPNVTAPIIVVASVQIGAAVLAEATISFLGLGVSSASNPSWGRMLQETRSVWQAAWWTAIIPGGAISVAVLAFNLFGDTLRDLLDPRLRGTR